MVHPLSSLPLSVRKNEKENVSVDWCWAAIYVGPQGMSPLRHVSSDLEARALGPCSWSRSCPADHPLPRAFIPIAVVWKEESKDVHME